MRNLLPFIVLLLAAQQKPHLFNAGSHTEPNRLIAQSLGAQQEYIEAERKHDTAGMAAALAKLNAVKAQRTARCKPTDDKSPICPGK